MGGHGAALQRTKLLGYTLHLNVYVLSVLRRKNKTLGIYQSIPFEVHSKFTGLVQ